jgi:hypothetical protein
MLQTRHVGALLLPALLVCGCESLNNTEKGAGIGGLLGAGTGALIGKATGHTGAGALIGAGTGALAGGLIGNAADKSEHKAEVAQAAAAQAQAARRMGISDVIHLAQAHVSDDVIISQIRTTGSTFQLTSSDTIMLKQQGVSDAVVEEMLRSASRLVPVYPARPVVVVEEPPPVYGGVIYTRYRRW